MVRQSRNCITSLCACLMVLATAPFALSQTVKIPDSTPVGLILSDMLSSATNDVDDPVHFTVADDVKVGDVVAIPHGSPATGHVVEAEGRKRMGRGGKLNFSVDYVKAPDGTNVRLRATSQRKGKDESGTVIIGTVLLSPLFLIRRGHDVTIEKGTRFNAYVDGDREVALSAQPASVALPALGTMAPPPQAAPGQLSSVVIKSNPDGADITVDANYVGSTPSTVKLAPGDHVIKVEKPGFKAWQRSVTVSPGSDLTINANLEKDLNTASQAPQGST